MEDEKTKGRNSPGGATPSWTVVVFVCQGLAYAIDVHTVRRIAWLPNLTPVEEMPVYVPGVLSMQGQVVPVVDLNARFGHPSRNFRITDSIIFFETRERLVGVVADEVLDVQEAVPVSVPATQHGILTGALEVGGRTVMLLSHDHILPADAGAAAEERKPFFPNATPEELAVLQARAEILLHEAKQEVVMLGGLAVVSLEGERFGIDLTHVREFSELGDIVPVPCCPPHITGNMNLRGDIVTVVDVRSVLRLPADEPHATKLIVSEHDGQLVGVPVEDVLSVLYIDPTQYHKLPAAVESAEQDFLLGEVPYEEKMLTVLDLKRVFERRELAVEEEV